MKIYRECDQSTTDVQNRPFSAAFFRGGSKPARRQKPHTKRARSPSMCRGRSTLGNRAREINNSPAAENFAEERAGRTEVMLTLHANSRK